MTDVISLMKNVEEEMDNSLTSVVGISRGKNQWGPAQFLDRKEPNIWQKQNYAQMLTGTDVKPVVEITDSDVNIIKNKAYRSLEWDFFNYLGELYKPEESPTNKEALMKVCPQWFDVQNDAIKRSAETIKKVQGLLINGAKNTEELMYLYQLGYKPGEGINKETTYNLGLNEALVAQLEPILKGSSPAVGAYTGYSKDADEQTKAFQRGLFNTDRHMTNAKALMGSKRAAFGNVGDYSMKSGGEKNIFPFGKGLKKPSNWAS